MTHGEVAAELGVTRQCVQQTERRALCKIRTEIIKLYGGHPFRICEGPKRSSLLHKSMSDTK